MHIKYNLLCFFIPYALRASTVAEERQAYQAIKPVHVCYNSSLEGMQNRFSYFLFIIL